MKAVGRTSQKVDTLKAARLYQSFGWAVIPVPSGRKSPVIAGWQKLRLAEADLETYFSDGSNIGINLGSASAGLIDVDLDCPEAVAVASSFLPETDLVSGRKSRPRSHQWYKAISTLPEYKKFCDPTREKDNCLLELRVGPGLQTLVPPSIHPDGEPYVWNSYGLPADVDGDKLKECVARLAVGALLTRHWPPKGSRHDVALALAGFLLRGGMSEEEVSHFVVTIAQTAGDEESKERLKDVKDTAEALVNGKKVTGGPRLAEIIGDKRIVEKVGQWLGISEGAKTPPELESRLIHPALHIEKGFASIGVVVRRDRKFKTLILTSNGGVYDASGLKEVFIEPPLSHPAFAGRWRPVGKTLSLSESLALLIDNLRDLVWFERRGTDILVALWSAGTYLFEGFPTYPYLFLNGEKGVGKSKVQDIIECVAFNSVKVVDPSPALIFRLVNQLRPTLLIDEAEKLDREASRELRSIINAGYKRGAVVPRVEGESRVIKFFNTYCPKALAGIHGLGSVTEDRCITIVMTKPGVGVDQQNREVDPEKSEWAIIRDGFYRLPFDYADKVMEKRLTLPVWLRARDRELWQPILKLAAVVDEESSLGWYGEVEELAKGSVGDKGLTFDADAVLGALESVVGDKESEQIHPFELVEALETVLNRKGKVRPEWIAAKLRTFGFYKVDRDMKGALYEITKTKLDEIRCRYAPPE